MASLDVSVDRKPMHTDRYLHFECHHPTHMKRGVVRCLHNRAREIISMQDNLQIEVDHLARVLKQNSYPANTISNAPTQETADTSSQNKGQEEEKGSLVVIPYVAGMSEDIRCACRKSKIRVVIKYGRTLRSNVDQGQRYSNPMWYIISPAAAARSTSGRPDGDWRRN